MAYYDRFRYIVEDIHGNIIARDVVGAEGKLGRMLSGPCDMELKLHPKDPSVQLPDGSGPIQFKPWGNWLHAVKDGLDGEEKIFCSGIVQPSDIDPETGILTLKAKGFSNYPKGLPWLVNWNPIAIDPAEIFTNIWTHLQSFDNGDLGVSITNMDGSTPAVTGTQMLPGFSFNGEEFVQDFFAIFIREVDRLDCGDYLNRLTRDIPLDYFETSTFNEAKTAISKSIKIAYPFGGVDQTDLIFRRGENVLAGTPKQETEIQWFSDITLKGYFPGKEYSATISNADTNRYRRVMDETDLSLDSNERAAAWGHRALTRRTFPNQYESIIIDPYHPNAPFGSYDVGDLIRIVGPMPWVGDMLDVKHKILGISWDEKSNAVQLSTMAEGAFNYDPIEYIEP